MQKPNPTRLALICLTLTFVASAEAAEQNCAIADQYTQLAQRAQEESRQQEALQLLEQSVAVCEQYQTYLSLGNVASAFANSKQSGRAAEAYVRAYELADSSADEAWAISRYAELLHNTNNSQQALKYIYIARNADPTNAEILALADKISIAAETISENEIVRGFGKLSLKPLHLKADLDGNAGGAGAARVDRSSVNIPLNFEFNTVQLTAESQDNLQVVAATLADKFSTDSFLFVGHADTRGSQQHNQSLSVARANEVRRQVVALRQQLATKISIAGKGESEPLSQGNEESDHRVNRRLEIIIQ